MEKGKQHLFEGMYIINASLSEDATGKALERITSGIENRGGEIKKIHDQGRKKLAYEINGFRQGYYYLLYFTLPPLEVKEIWKEYHLNEDLIRFFTLRTNEVMEKIEFKPLKEED